MIKNKKVRVLLIILEIILIIFQVSVVLLAIKKDYYLIYDWIFYGANYLIVVILLLLICKNKYIKWFQIGISLALFIINSTVIYCFRDTTTLISKSPEGNNEIVLKEYNNMKFETIRLRPRGIIFGKKVESLKGSSEYKAINEWNYKIEWADNDVAILTFQIDSKEHVEQNFYNFRDEVQISYKNVLPSLYGKWISEENADNYFMVNLGDIVYAKDGNIYYYTNEQVKQRGELGIEIIDNIGEKPSFTLVLNSDSIIGDNCLINDNGSVTISEITLKYSKGEVFRKE